MKQIIRILHQQPEIVDDSWQLVGLDDPLPANQPILMPLQRWLQYPPEWHGNAPVGVWLDSNDSYETVAGQLASLPLVAINFPTFRDGRGYTIAFFLRQRFGYQGELRAIGDVLRDQLFYMHRCGFDSFDVRADKDIHDALLGLTAYTVYYQGAVSDPQPLFRKRAECLLYEDDDHWEP